MCTRQLSPLELMFYSKHKDSLEVLSKDSGKKKHAFSAGGLLIFSWSLYTSKSFWEVLELLRRYRVTTEAASLTHSSARRGCYDP